MYRVAASTHAAGTRPHARDRTTTTGRTVASPAPYCRAAAVLGDQLARGGVVQASNDAAARHRYSPGYDARIANARRTLAVHRISTETTRCQACHRSCPCDAANEAANTLVGDGWPVEDPARETGDGVPGAGPAPRGRWAAALSWLRDRLSVDQDW
jgi:hypothetical protein